MRPMLAATVENVNELPFPLYASPKLDGIRCIVYNKEPLTRKLKLIPNRYIRSMLCQHSSILDNYDGELVVGKNFQETASAVMSFEGEPDFRYHIFDCIDGGAFFTRFIQHNKPQLGFIEIVPQVLVESVGELERYEDIWVTAGYEGVMLRRADGKDLYKFNRSTLKEAYLLKLKRFKDDEATIIGFEERTHNNNILEKDNLGHAKRSTSKIGMIKMGTLGSLYVSSSKLGEFCIGSGFTDIQRKKIWDNKTQYMGKLVKFKYQEQGIKNKPRFPIFLGFRDWRD